jgi:AcrR family transcriptional regulator
MAQTGKPSDDGLVTSSKERLIQASRQLMTERNTVDFSLQDIAVRTGLNSALVKYHFGNKDGLLLAVLRSDVERELKRLARLISLPLTPTEKLATHIEAMIDVYFRKPYMERLVHHLMHDRGDEPRNQVLAFFIKPFSKLQRQILEEGIQNGEFKPVDPGFLYHAVGSLCDALFRWHPELWRVWGISVSNDQRRKFGKFAIDLVLNGIVAKRRPSTSACKSAGSR